jgi:hypothetical protein
LKAYDIALFLIFLLFSINFITASGVLGSDVNVYFGGYAQSINQSVTGAAPQVGEEISYPELAISSFGLLVRTLVVVILILLYSTILLPVFLGQLGLPAEMNAMITVGVWITYVIGYNQYRARSTLQGLE